MSDGLSVGTRVRVTNSPNRDSLPNGTTGVIREIVGDYDDKENALFFEADSDADLPYGTLLLGDGYPLFGGEVENIA